MTDESPQGKKLSEEEMKLLKERKARKLRRQKLLEQQRKNEEEKAKKFRKLVFSSILWIFLILVSLGLYLTVKNGIAADFLTHQGQKYIEIKEYDKALKMLKIAESLQPDNENIVYYQVIALSRSVINYDTLKSLYEISQYDDFDDASEYAHRTLVQIREQIDSQIGDNYIDSVLYDGIIYRWNNKNPINYTITLNGSIPSSYITEIKKAFTAWSGLSNGYIVFNYVTNPEEADIVVFAAEGLPESISSAENKSAVVIPSINDNILNRVDIILKRSIMQENRESILKFSTLMKAQVGHALGIAGNSFDENDIMSSSNDDINKAQINRSFTVRDYNTFTLLYKLLPDVINSPISPDEYSDFFFHNAITSIPGDGIDKQMKQIMAYLNNNPEDISKWVDLASNYGTKKNYRHANAILKNVFPLVRDDNNNCFVVLYNIAVNYYKMKEYKEASRYIQAARRFNPSDLDALILELFIDLRLDNKEQAIKKLESLNSKYPDNIEVALKLAYIYRKNKEFEKLSAVINNLMKSNSEAGYDKRVLKYTHHN